MIIAAFPLLAFLCKCTPPISLNTNEDEGGGGEGGELTTNVSIEYIKTLYSGTSQQIIYDLAIEGIITANDAYGEFPNSVVIEDSSGAIELMCEFDCAAVGYIFGATVKVVCNGLWIGAVGGAIVLGAKPTSQSAVDEIAEEDMSYRLQLCSNDPIIPIPKFVSIQNLTANHILRYVCIDDLYTPVQATFCSRDTESGHTEHTEHTLLDSQGDEITLVVDSSVRYADDDVPSSPTSIFAIVEYFNGEYRIRITNCGY